MSSHSLPWFCGVDGARGGDTSRGWQVNGRGWRNDSTLWGGGRGDDCQGLWLWFALQICAILQISANEEIAQNKHWGRTSEQTTVNSIRLHKLNTFRMGESFESNQLGHALDSTVHWKHQGLSGSIYIPAGMTASTQLLTHTQFQQHFQFWTPDTNRNCQWDHSKQSWEPHLVHKNVVWNQRRTIVRVLTIWIVWKKFQKVELKNSAIDPNNQLGMTGNRSTNTKISATKADKLSLNESVRPFSLHNSPLFSILIWSFWGFVFCLTWLSQGEFPLLEPTNLQKILILHL